MDEQKIAKKLVEAVENARLEVESKKLAFIRTGPDSFRRELDEPTRVMRETHRAADEAYQQQAGDAEKRLQQIKDEADAAFKAVYDRHVEAVALDKAVTASASHVRSAAYEAADLAYNTAKNEIKLRHTEEVKAATAARDQAERDLVLAVIGGPWKNKPWKYGTKRAVSRVFWNATRVIAELRLDLFNARRMLPDRAAEDASARLTLVLGAPIRIVLTTERVEGTTLAEALHNAEDVAIEDGWYARETVSTPEESGR